MTSELRLGTDVMLCLSLVSVHLSNLNESRHTAHLLFLCVYAVFPHVEAMILTTNRGVGDRRLATHITASQCRP